MAADKLDRRVRRTREAISRALLTLVIEKGYDAVTVTDIIERADIGRSTFYTHFTDKRDVLFRSLDQVAGILRAHHDAGPDRLFAFSLPLFEHLGDQHQLIRALLGRRGSAVVQARVQQVLADVVRDELVARLPDGTQPPQNLNLTVAAVVGAYLALVAQWVDDPHRHTPRQLDAAFRALVIPSVTAMLSS